MIFQSHGLSCVSISAKPVVGDVSVVLDPYDNSTGLRFPRTLAADVVFSSKKGPEHGNLAGVQGSPFAVDMPGEYEVKGVMMDSRLSLLKDGEHHMVLRLAAEGITIGFLGGLDRQLNDEELELLEGVDILIIPVGGESVMTPKEAVNVIQSIEPRVVIPVYTAEDGLKEKVGTIAAFKKELGPVTTDETNKFKIVKTGLPQDDMLLVILKK
ncbi:MBL fold metallo-hydrolase [Candidatus Uhrbacteria bacterium]|nr:MBL fold metallo-hydrolase [Candidatus Uhrbacteria bacterium]